MPLDKGAGAELISHELFPRWQKENERLERIDLWYRWRHEPIVLPRTATRELKRLVEMSRVPWLGLVVSAISQCLYVDGFHSTHDPIEKNEATPTGPWKTWNANGFAQRQIAVHRAALAYGYSFVCVMPGEDNEGKRSVLRGVSPRKAYAAYEDPAEDEWPKYVLRVMRGGEGVQYEVRLYDDQYIHTYTMDNPDAKPKFIKRERHGANVCPFVRYANQLDLDGRCDGEVEPFIPLASRINKTSYDRLLTQHFNSWKIRVVTGMTQPETDEAKNREKLKLRQDDLLIAEDPDTKVYTLDETSLEGFIAAWRSDIEALAAVSQTPTYALTGQIANLSAEALAAARSSLTQKIAERQKGFGASHVQTLRLSAALEGDQDRADDVMSRVTWQDMEIRSFSQSVDALGKAAQMLGVPLPALWMRIPGVEKTDVDEWKKLAAELDPIENFRRTLERQEGPEDE